LIGPNANSVWNITGAGSGTVGTVTFTGMANLTGGSAADTFTLANGASVSGKIDGGAGTDTLKYSYTSAVTVNWAALTATGAGSIANFEGLVGGSSTSDTLIGPNSANAWTVATANAGKVNTFTFSGVENLTGGSANDNFVLGRGIGVAGQIDGGAGINMLDYAAYTTAVNVSLASGSATSIGHGVSNISVVRGGSSNDILTGGSGSNVLIGGAGNDTLTAGSGRDILFGGLGADTLTGGADESILISGTTKFDTNVTMIDNLLTYWGRTDLAYAARVSALRTGSVIGVSAMNSTNVLADTSIDKLSGGASLDWFFATLSGAATDTVANLSSGELEN
jgi:Ca2+-binding RTX toxin-like protein